MDFDSSSDEDTESELNDLRQLTAVIAADEASLGENTSQSAAPIPSTSNAATSSAHELRKIETALALNKLYDEKLQRLEKLLGSRLQECRNKLAQVQNESHVLEKCEVFRYVSCGKPYFKDKLGFPAPQNEDALMAQSQMYDFSQILSVPGWSVNDKSNFLTLILKCSRELKKAELKSKISALKRIKKKDVKEKNEKEILKLTIEISNIHNKPLSEVALPIDVEYDWETIANKLSRRHTPQEYQALWKLFFHPSINKNSWSNAEHKALQNIVGVHKGQDWDAIAKDLNTGRTGYQCFVYYRTNMTTTFCGKRWSPEEVTYLRRLIEYFKEDNYIPWGKIASAMENRTKIQIYNKYMRLTTKRKGRFLPQEDTVILNCVDKFGTDFIKMTDYLPGRTRDQIRSRYNVISKMRISTVWTIDDDRKLLQIMSNLDEDMNFSEASKYFPGKTRTSLRSRYHILTKWMKKYPNRDVEFAPRRNARRLNHGYAGNDLNTAIEDLKNTLNSEAIAKNIKGKITMDSPEVDIEDAITVILINKMVNEEVMKRNATEDQAIVSFNDKLVSQEELNTKNLRNILIFLVAKLNKEIFKDSLYCEQYPTLADTTIDVSMVKMKSYSKTNVMNSIKQVSKCPTLWGDSLLKNRKFVLPPHYATITGCKSLMANTTRACKEASSLHLMVKRNPVFKEQFHNLLERFYLLFLWPMLMSNLGPKEQHEQPSNLKKVQKTKLPVAPPITIRTVFNKKLNKIEKAKGIDLPENVENDVSVKLNVADVDW